MTAEATLGAHLLLVMALNDAACSGRGRGGNRGGSALCWQSCCAAGVPKRSCTMHPSSAHRPGCGVRSLDTLSIHTASNQNHVPSWGPTPHDTPHLVKRTPQDLSGPGQHRAAHRVKKVLRGQHSARGLLDHDPGLYASMWTLQTTQARLPPVA